MSSISHHHVSSTNQLDSIVLGEKKGVGSIAFGTFISSTSTIASSCSYLPMSSLHILVLSPHRYRSCVDIVISAPIIMGIVIGAAKPPVNSVKTAAPAP